MPVIMLAGIAAAGLLCHGHRFPAAVFSCAVHWYFQFQPRLRDLEALLFERGVVVSYESIRRWCDKFGAGFARRGRPQQYYVANNLT
jgi:transposase-like protein